MDYTETRRNIENHLDECGIGADVQNRLNETMKRIAVLSADVCAASTSQALHDALTNKPQGIRNDDRVGKDDAERAFSAGVVSVLGALVGWDILLARQLAADILDDVNDHDRADQIRSWDD